MARRRATGVVACIWLLGVLAVGVVAFSWPSSSPQGVARGADGCEVRAVDEDTPDEQRVATVVPEHAAPTAMDHARPGIDLRHSLLDVQRLLAGYEPVAEFTLPSTGMHVTVLSDGPLHVDPEAFDRLVRLPITQPRMFGDAQIAEIQGCYARRLLDGQEFAGRVLRVFVPSSPARCFRSGVMVNAEVGCDSAGVTLPQVELRPQLFGVEVGAAALPATVIVTAASRLGDPNAETRLASVLLHELHHVTENGFGLMPWAGSLRHYEQRAYYVERAVREHLRRHGLPLPRPIRFVPDATQRG